MSTAQVALELVVAGVLGLLVVLLPWVGPACGVEIAGSSLAVPMLAAAYVVGVLFDKVFDHVLRHEEARLRRRVMEESTAAPAEAKDPFPLAAIEARLRAPSDAAAWMGYLRTRVRLARALAVTAPLLGASLSWSFARPHSCLDALYRVDGIRLASLVPLLGLALAATCAAPAPAKTWQPKRSPWPGVLALAMLHLVPIVAIASALVDREASGPFRIVVSVAGTLLGLVALWAHAALTTTYFKFLRASDGVRPRSSGAEAKADPPEPTVSESPE